MEYEETEFEMGGGWNYRMVEVDGFYHLREIYYKPDGSIQFWTQEPAAPVGDDPEDLAGALELMKGALNRPILKLVDNTWVEVDNGTQ